MPGVNQPPRETMIRKKTHRGIEMTQQTMTKAAFARLCDVSKPAVAKWISRGSAALAENGEIHLAATAAHMRAFRMGGLPLGFQAFIDAGSMSEAEPSAASSRLALAQPVPPIAVQIRRADLVARLEALDWKAHWSLDDESLRNRVTAAAVAVGFELAESDEDDDGHWGGYQLRSLATMAKEGGICFDAIVAGYGYELDAWDVLRECREVISHPDDVEGDGDDLIAFDLALLPALAYPFGPMHRPRAPNESAQ
jgi:hypothetical protein